MYLDESKLMKIPLMFNFRGASRCLLAVFLAWASGSACAAESHLLYLAAPGVRNDLKFGGAGILVFDIDAGHRFVRRIETPASRIEKPENIKGICASAATGRLYFTTLTK